MIIHARAKHPFLWSSATGAPWREPAPWARSPPCSRAASGQRSTCVGQPATILVRQFLPMQRKETPRINDPHRYSTSLLGRRAMPVRPSTVFADSRDPEQIAPPKEPFGAHNTIWLTSHRLTDSGAQMVPGNFAPMARTPMETSFRDEIKVGSKAITHTCALMQQTAFHLLAG